MKTPRFSFLPSSGDRHQAFTLLELLVVIGILLVLAAMAVPAMTGAQDKARTSKSISNMKQVATGIINYSADNNGCLPPLYGGQYWTAPYWTTIVHPYVYGSAFVPAGNRFAGEVFYCPSVKRHHPIGDWSLNSNVAPFNSQNRRLPLARIEKPSATALLFEGRNIQNSSDTSWYFNVPLAKADPTGWFGDWHKGNPLVAFCDGSVRSCRYQDLLNTWVDMAGPDPDSP